ncbi:WD repeat-containing protein 62 [Silurus asotus]|uniref:WD repeat-containing protein 62 n=1 Tax=Silurus asotus TaxID=30991 RepID=A0AAD5B1R7_SILAS|nr:WD repeat-containing protein 62 [Silurus asotus]
MAEGASLSSLSSFSGGINASSLTSRVKKPNSSNVHVNARRNSRQSHKRDIHTRVVLERVLGITTTTNSGLACDPNTGTVAYPAGCVIVLLNPKTNNQSHIFNTSRKTFSALAFSQNGKYLVTGESGHMPCVRVWDVAERTQVAEVQCHKYGVACVAFSTNGSYIVSVGFQHDRTVSVWEWKKGTVIASNKVSSRVLAVSFSEDSSYFVTAGNRHVKFWYLDASKERRVNSTVPLIGRSGLLGEHQNSEFCDLVCGRGTMSSSTYCITHTGLLCQFNSNRQLDLWVDLKTSSARCLSVGESFIFCGCSDGTVRVFSPQNLHYITTLPQPHCLGVDVSQGMQPKPEAEYPDTLALTHDPVTSQLTCVYNDHSVYVWDVHDVKNVEKVYSSLYHSSCVWSVETYPELEDSPAALLPGSFLTCSSDNTIRLWNIDFQQSQSQSSNLYSQDLVKIVYVDNDTGHLKAPPDKAEGNQDGKFGIRVLGISPDGQHLAVGDRSGNLRIYGLQFMDELLRIEAHDSEILCLAFSPTETGVHLLASAGRDRLIHLFNMDKSYSLLQTVYDHSASVTAMKFTGIGPKVSMVSCGADKSIYFRSAEKTSQDLTFSRSHHVVEKSTLYDMDLDATLTHTAIACQDRNIRVYNVKSGKMKKCFKGSLTDDGPVLKVQLDPSGMFLATSCSDKSICVFDYETEECVATLFGHSEIVTGMKFSPDCKHLITVCGDSCVFFWRLCSQMTNSMRKRLAERKRRAGLRNLNRVSCKQQAIRRETYITVPCSGLAEPKAGQSNSLFEEKEKDPKTPGRLGTDVESLDFMMPQTNGRLPMWARRLGAGVGSGSSVESQKVPQYQPQGRWAAHADPFAIRSVLETRSLQLPLSDTPSRGEEDENECVEEKERHEVDFHPQSLDSLLDEEEESGDIDEEDIGRVSEQFSSVLQDTDLQYFSPRLSSSENNDCSLYPANSTALSTVGEGEFDVKALCDDAEIDPEEEELSPDSACSAESDQVQSDQAHDQDTDSLSQASSMGSSGVEEEEEEEPANLLRQHYDSLAVGTNEKFNTDLRNLQPSSENFLNPRLSLSTRFLSRFQSRIRGTTAGSSVVCRSRVHLPSIPDESSSIMEKTEDNSQLIFKALNLNAIRSDQKKCDKALILQEKNNNDPGIVVPKPDNSTFDASKSSCQSTMDITNGKNKSMGEKFDMCPEQDHEKEILWNASLPNQEHSVTQDSKEDLPLPHSFTLTTHSSNPALPMATTALDNLSARTILHLDLSSPLPPAALNVLKRQAEHMHPLCRQVMVSPTEMKSLGKERPKEINRIEKKLMTSMSHRLSSDLLKESLNESSLVAPENIVESPQSGTQCNTAKSALSVTTVDGPQSVDPDETINLQACKEMVNVLQHTMHRAASFYSKLQGINELSDQQMQMKSMLQEAFSGILQELHCLSPQDLNSVVTQLPEDSPGRQLRDDRAMALLERYSDMLLLRMSEKKLGSN